MMWIGSLCEEVKKCFPFFAQKKPTPAFSEDVDLEVKLFIENLRFDGGQDKVENRWLFEEITHSYKKSFKNTSTYKLVKMTKFLTEGFRVCKPQHQRIFEIWALETMVGSGRAIIKEEMKKERSQWRWEIYYGLSPSQIFEKSPIVLAQIVESVQENYITEKMGKAILKIWLSNKSLDVKQVIQVCSKNPECRPATKNEVQQAVEEFIDNLDDHYLEKRIVKAFHDYYWKTTLCKNSNKKMSKRIRHIQRLLEKNDVLTLIKAEDTSRFIESARKITRHNPYFKRVDHIEKILHSCLKLKNQPSPSIKEMLFEDGFPSMHFVCQPIMKSLNYRTSKKAILEALKESFI